MARQRNDFTVEDLRSAYRQMLTIRRAEEALRDIFAAGEVPGFIHLSIGQEAVAAGVGAALEKGDTVASTHRGHGHALAKGMSLDALFLEIMGKAEGICQGRGGSMHVADLAIGMLGANGIVGAGIPIAVGSALAHKTLKNGAIAVAFFGDGALAEGVVHESLNLAALWSLPVLFVCENNGWSEFSPTDRQIRASACTLAGPFGIPCETVNGNDVVDVMVAAGKVVAEVRTTGTPRMLECRTQRWQGHFEGDPQKYRPQDELTSLAGKDPLAACRKALAAKKVSNDEIAAIDSAVERSVAAALAAGRRGTVPAFAPALAGVYAGAPANG